jgi:hypothetical protein
VLLSRANLFQAIEARIGACEKSHLQQRRFDLQESQIYGLMQYQQLCFNANSETTSLFAFQAKKSVSGLS